MFTARDLFVDVYQMHRLRFTSSLYPHSVKRNFILTSFIILVFVCFFIRLCRRYYPIFTVIQPAIQLGSSYRLISLASKRSRKSKATRPFYLRAEPIGKNYLLELSSLSLSLDGNNGRTDRRRMHSIGAQ